MVQVPQFPAYSVSAKMVEFQCSDFGWIISLFILAEFLSWCRCIYPVSLQQTLLFLTAVGVLQWHCPICHSTLPQLVPKLLEQRHFWLLLGLRSRALPLLCAMLSPPAVVLHPYSLPVYPPAPQCYSGLVQVWSFELCIHLYVCLCLFVWDRRNISVSLT